MRGFASAVIVWYTHLHKHTLLKTRRSAVISALCGRWGARESQWQAQDVPDCQGRARWHWCEHAHTRTHTPRSKWRSNESARLRIIPSGQIYVFRDIQVAGEDGAKASERSLDILTNPFKLVVSCTFATFASSQNWLFHICELSCWIGRWHGADEGRDGSHTETDCDWIQLTPPAGGYWPFCSCCLSRSGFFTLLVSHTLANISPSSQHHYIQTSCSTAATAYLNIVFCRLKILSERLNIRPQAFGDGLSIFFICCVAVFCVLP